MDNSSALLLSTVQKFAGINSLNEYLDKCFEALFNNAQAPRCLILLDRSHVVAIIMRMFRKIKCHHTVQNMIQRVFGYLILVNDIKIAEEVVRNTFILLHSERYNEDVRAAHDYLKKYVDQHDSSQPQQENDKNESISYDNSENFLMVNDQNKFKTWADNISKEVHQKCNDRNILNNSGEVSPPNVFNCASLVQIAVNHFSKIVLYSNVMCGKGSSGASTSSGTESGFRNIKTFVFNGDRNIRVDRFVTRHIDHIDGDMKLNLSESKKDTEKPEIEQFYHKDVVYEEDWRKQNPEAVQNNTETTSISDENMEEATKRRCKKSILNKLNTVGARFNILKNGHTILVTKPFPHNEQPTHAVLMLFFTHMLLYTVILVASRKHLMVSTVSSLN